MRYIFTLIAIIFLSCSRNGSSLPNGNSSDTEISFDLAGEHYSYKGDPTGEWYQSMRMGVYGYRSLTQFKYIYGFEGAEKISATHFELLTDSLATTTYHLNARIYTKDKKTLGGDGINITITSYQNGFVNATFSGNTKETIGTIQRSISNGKFKNVKLVYNN